MSIDVPGEELVRRLSGRWDSPDSGHVYHEIPIRRAPPASATSTGRRSIRREDDRRDGPGAGWPASSA